MMLALADVHVGTMQRVLESWEEISTQMQGTPSVSILRVDCGPRGAGREACKDHGVQRLPAFQVFRPGSTGGEWFRPPASSRKQHDVTWDLEAWVRSAMDLAHVRPREVAGIAGCVAFRQTGACDPGGPREPHLDRHCEATVGAEASGFCECAPGDLRSHIGCGHVPFTCHDVCVDVPGVRPRPEQPRAAPSSPEQPRAAPSSPETRLLRPRLLVLCHDARIRVQAARPGA